MIATREAGAAENHPISSENGRNMSQGRNKGYEKKKAPTKKVTLTSAAQLN